MERIPPNCGQEESPHKNVVPNRIWNSLYFRVRGVTGYIFNWVRNGADSPIDKAADSKVLDEIIKTG